MQTIWNDQALATIIFLDKDGCIIEDDHLELCYSDTASSYIRRYEDKEEFEVALTKRKEEEGEMRFDENQGFDEDEFGEEEEEEGEEFDISDESDKF